MLYTPAEYVIRIFKGVRATARMLDKSPSTICKWQKYRNKSGAIGQVPTSVHRQILEIAKKSGLDITPEDLVYGREMPLHDVMLEAKKWD